MRPTRVALSVASFTWLFAAAALAAPEGPSPDPVRLLILPIVVHSASPDASHVSGGLSDMLAARLEQSGRIVVERPEGAELATSRVGAALREGRARGSEYAIFGAFTQFGDGASLDIQCIPVGVSTEAEAIAARRIFIQSGAVGDLIPRLDEIAQRLVVYLNGGQPPLAVDGAAPTASEAEAMRKLGERLEALEKAVFGSADASAAAQVGEVLPES